MTAESIATTTWHYHQTCHHRTYYLTCDDYDGLWRYAGGRCQICGLAAEEAPRGKLFIDHDGRYGWWAVRGILCPECNTHMGFVDRNAKRPDHQVMRYVQYSWFVRVLQGRAAADPNRRPERWTW